MNIYGTIRKYTKHSIKPLNYYLLYLILGPSFNMRSDRTLPQLPKLQISES